MIESTTKFSCRGCGKAYAFKPEYAGRAVKCKCGETMKFPSKTAAARPPSVGLEAAGLGKKLGSGGSAKGAAPAKPVYAPAPSADDLASEFEQAFAGGAYEVADDPAPVTPMRGAAPTVYRAIPGAVASGGAASSAGAASPVLGYAATRKKPVEDDATRASQVKDVYVPVGLLGAGLALSYVDGYLYGVHNPALITIYVLTVAIVNLVMVFAALMLAVRIMDLGLGNLGPALLKIAAVALLPAAVAGIIGHYTFGMMNWGISALCYYLLLFSLFDMDAQEMVMTTTIIWVIRFVINLFILALVAKGLGVAIDAASKGLPSGHSLHGTTGSDDGSAPAGPSNDAIDAQTDEAIRTGQAVEAGEWLKPEHKDHAGFKMSKEQMLQIVQKFQAAGSKMVYMSDIEKLNNVQISATMLVEMPDDPAARKAVLKVYDDVQENETATKDEGQKSLRLTLD